ncbi:hypothetical protein S40288_09743 [Stachybotrys chartarum IBT 40288]|nr:hypothetical protein S40288_09743 [Stachybotrys chartarum IBT 40288]
MTRSAATSTRKYGKPSKRTKAERLFAELAQSPVRKPVVVEAVDCLAEKLSSVNLEDAAQIDSHTPLHISARRTRKLTTDHIQAQDIDIHEQVGQPKQSHENRKTDSPAKDHSRSECPKSEDLKEEIHAAAEVSDEAPLRILTWDDVCPPSDRIDKIAEASFAEVYRVTNERGTSIIKVIRLSSQIKPQTKAQVRSGLVDEEPHAPDDLQGELQISEWLADIPGFVVYKERYIVQGKATRQLLETHQAFHKKMKRQDPERAQFYPSPSRYLDDTKFLVVELGDAGKALEDWELLNIDQLWDIFFLEAIALARAEDLVLFEHRDLHEGNLCIRQARPPIAKDDKTEGFFGFSGLDITILDYGLSRAEDLSCDDGKIVAFDLEKDLSIFTSTHATQCKVYRQMRSFLLRADRVCLPPEAHETPYTIGIDGPISWDAYAPYTNVLWLAYLYEYMTENFMGDKKELALFKKTTKEMWKYLNPQAKQNVPCFGSAADIVCFAVEAGWVREEQVMGAGNTVLDREDSIIISRDECIMELPLRRSPRRAA